MICLLSFHPGFGELECTTLLFSYKTIKKKRLFLLMSRVEMGCNLKNLVVFFVFFLYVFEKLLKTYHGVLSVDFFLLVVILEHFVYEKMCIALISLVFCCCHI